jgi:molecular chaperone HscB
LLNKAYFTLLKPLPRVLYILELHGLAISEDTIEMDPEFLMEVMELNERIGDASDKEIQQIEKEVHAIIESKVEALAQVMKQKDYVKARDITIKLKYYDNVESKVKTFYRDRM